MKGSSWLSPSLLVPVAVLLAIAVVVAAYTIGGYNGVEGLGEAGYSLGIAATLQFVMVKYARRILVPDILGAGRYAWLYRWSLELHTAGNLSAAILAGSHAYANRQLATPLEYSMVALILLLTMTGSMLRYARGRRLKLYARLIHGQRILALLLLALATIHAETHG